jgi:hypothetical protein
MALSDTTCRSAKPSSTTRKLSDGGGLQLWVQPNGGRLWRLAYRYRGKQKLLSFGSYPAVSLLSARSQRDAAKVLLAQGIDPSQAKKDAKADQAASENTFKAIAAEYLAHQRQNKRAGSTMVKLEWLLDFAYPKLGERLMTEIRPLAGC